MDALEEGAWLARMFRKERLIYLYCFDTEHVFELSVPSLPFLKLKCLFGHISLPGTLPERRIAVFPQSERLLEKLKGVISPCVIEVTASVEFQIHPDEVEDDHEVMLIWDFNVNKIASLTAAQFSVNAKMPNCADTLPSMPLLDLKTVSCNCVDSKGKGKVVLESCGAASAAADLKNLSISSNVGYDDSNDSDSESENFDEEEEDDSPEEFEDLPLASGSVSGYEEFTCVSTIHSKETLFTEAFALKSASYHEHFQRNLKLCKEQLMNKKVLPVKLRFEPVNRRDENAILVLASPRDSWEPIGYVPGIKVPKLTIAIRNNEITKMTVIYVRYNYVSFLKSYKYQASVSISKKGKWVKNKDKYKYNEEI